jgi:(S)-2-hydroxy-acid oxidase
VYIRLLQPGCRRYGNVRLTLVSRKRNDKLSNINSLKDNERAFSRYKLQPRVLRDVGGVDTSTTIFGTKVSFPLGFAPAAAHKLAHQDGEIATSRAASKNNIPMCLSSWSTSSVEDVVAQGAGNPYAMQITFFKDTEITKRTIHQAESKLFPSSLKY